MHRKMTRAYQMKAVTTGVRAFRFKSNWYPVTDKNWEDKEVFIKGTGWKRYTDSMRNSVTDVPNLPSNWTAKDVREVVENFSLDVAYGLLEGWCGSLFSDGSIGLSYHKHEVANMWYFGETYDEFTNILDDLSQRWIKHLLTHGYHFEGAWMYYKDELIGQAGITEEIRLSPLQHIDHLLMGVAHVRPMFDPISFDKLLVKLIIARPKGEALLDKYVSVKDRIKFLSTQKIADDFEKIFEQQKVFDPIGEERTK